MSEPYDTIVIGSGIGGLTAAAFLARGGRKVLVLEQHSKIGGYAHSFKRRSFSFESGIHSAPMGQRGMVMHLLRLLGVDTLIETIPQDEIFRFMMPGFSYTLPARREDFVDKLKQDFPHEAENIDRLLLAMAKIYEAMVLRVYKMESKFLDEDREFASRYINVSYTQFIGRYIEDPRLRTIFLAQWPYGGMSPDQAPAIFYTIMFFVHYLDGSHACSGGFQSLAAALLKAITDHGGAVRTKCRVVRLECEKDRVRAVHCENGDSFECGVVVSNVSPYLLHNGLIDEPFRSRIWARRLSNLNPSISGVTVYCGLDRLASYFVNESITFWFNDRFEAVYGNIHNGVLGSRDHLALLRTPDRESRTLQLIYFATRAASADWKEAKKTQAEWMLQKADELFPGLGGAVVLTETGSPTTFERYTGNTDGAFYGFENAKELYGEAKLPSTTYLKNLYQAGHWGKPGGGVWNVMVNGYIAAKTILRDIG